MKDLPGMIETADVLILSNGPGELATWVKPVVQQLRQQFGDDRQQLRISVVLSPCPHASGREAAIAQSYPEVDRVLAPQQFFPFLLWGKTAENWDWRSQGVVIFLGGDQFYPVVIGKRLGYRTLVYAEWEARWHGWIDRFAIMRPEIATRAATKHATKFAVVGDLMAEAGRQNPDEAPATIQDQDAVPLTDLVGFLPGSKATKLLQGVPFVLAVAEKIHAVRPATRFVIPVAPALTLQTLAGFANRQTNSIVDDMGGIEATLITPPEGMPFLETTHGVRVELWTESPAYELLAQCRLCLTTIGANTAELGSLGVPMIVLLPTQRLDVIPLDGILGLLTRLPGVGATLASVYKWWAVKNLGLLAWPNIWAGEAIVPELVGKLDPQAVADLALDLLSHPEKLDQMQQKLRQVRGEPGAAAKLVQLVQEQLQLLSSRRALPSRRPSS